ncbi:Polyamine N-acetyltransferase 1 [Spathaspora sp. JA1]|nr:Polyamine N-acetyltransferase 1 [Spathaspora sp. JA1]
MSDFPPNLSIRPLTIADLDQCIELEKKGFSEDERASPEKLKYRLTVCPELCSGLFIREYIYKYNAINLPEVAETLEKNHENDTKQEQPQGEEDEDDEDFPTKSSVTKETLVGHIIGTKIYGDRITNESMELPSSGLFGAGHIESSRHIGIHSVVIDPQWQGKNLGALLLHDYIQKLSNQDLGDQILIIVHRGLIPFYEKIGFNNLGESKCKFAGTSWNDMSIDLVAVDDL